MSGRLPRRAARPDRDALATRSWHAEDSRRRFDMHRSIAPLHLLTELLARETRVISDCIRKEIRDSAASSHSPAY
jgi:hypothetical protein